MIGIPAVAVLKKKNNSNRNDYTNKPTTASIFSALLSNSSSCLKVCPARLNSHEFFLGKIFFFFYAANKLAFDLQVKVGQNFLEAEFLKGMF